jgi:hypothetical protein
MFRGLSEHSFNGSVSRIFNFDYSMEGHAVA